MRKENLIVDDLSKNTYLEPNIEICDVEDWVVYENENDPAFSHLAKVLLNKIPSNENDIDWDNLDCLRWSRSCSKAVSCASDKARTKSRCGERVKEKKGPPPFPLELELCPSQASRS